MADLTPTDRTRVPQSCGKTKNSFSLGRRGKSLSQTAPGAGVGGKDIKRGMDCDHFRDGLVQRTAAGWSNEHNSWGPLAGVPKPSGWSDRVRDREVQRTRWQVRRKIRKKKGKEQAAVSCVIDFLERRETSQSVNVTHGCPKSEAGVDFLPRSTHVPRHCTRPPGGS